MEPIEANSIVCPSHVHPTSIHFHPTSIPRPSHVHPKNSIKSIRLEHFDIQEEPDTIAKLFADQKHALWSILILIRKFSKFNFSLKFHMKNHVHPTSIHFFTKNILMTTSIPRPSIIFVNLNLFYKIGTRRCTLRSLRFGVMKLSKLTLGGLIGPVDSENIFKTRRKNISFRVDKQKTSKFTISDIFDTFCSYFGIL